MKIDTLYLVISLPTAIALPASSSSPSPNEPLRLVNKALTAMGGVEVLESIKGITYHAPNQTLTQNYNLHTSDQSVATSGSQNISFSYASGHLQARIDRTYQYGDYWIWASPDLKPDVKFAVAIRDGPSGYACFVEGQNNFYSTDNSAVPLGYADSLLTSYLIHSARQHAVPGLLLQFLKDNKSLGVGTYIDLITFISFDTVTDKTLGLTLIFNSTSSLPYMVRSYELHALFGNSTSDLVLSAYNTVTFDENKTVRLPHRLQLLYNDANILEDSLIEEIAINPQFPENFFQGNSKSDHERGRPQSITEADLAEVHEFFEAALWSGRFEFNTSDVVETLLSNDIPQIRSVYVGYPDYVQLLVEFEDGVLLTDAPVSRSSVILTWVKENIGKPVKYIVPSHHHHDHAYGVAEYVQAGASLVVPEVAASFYKNVNNGNVDIVTYNQSNSFILKDSQVQFRSMWREEAVHARDWSYSVATKACPEPYDDIVAFNADVWSPGSNALRFDAGYARKWLQYCAEDGLPAKAKVIGAHRCTPQGTTDALANLIDIVGFAYPNSTLEGWKAGGSFC